MHQQTLQHGYMTERQRWLALALALGVALGTQAALAKECHRETPLPTDVHLSAPGPEVPEAIARFAGVWSGAWLDQGSEALCHTLVVEEVFAHGYALVVYSIGTHARWDIRQPTFLRATGRIADGTLRFHLPVPKRPTLAYRFVGEMLQGTANDGGSVHLHRVEEDSQMGCGAPAGSTLLAPPTGPRDRLTAAELLATATVSTGPVHTAYFLPVGHAAPAVHPFQGTVTIPAFTIFRSRHGCPGLSETLPGFTVAFLTEGEHLVPVVRDIVAPPGIILSPGRVWSEPSDGEMSRASLPFVLTNPYYNAAHHGLATFLYDDTRVSTLRVQVVQETDIWFAKYDGWGQVPMTYTPGPIANADTVRAQFVVELQQQTPIRPWSALPAAPGAKRLEGFDGDTAPDALKVSGIILDGALYVRGCETRSGPYPYCRQMRHGVFSVTKSMGAAVALLRLAQKYGDEVFALKIKEYVPVTAAHDGWERVTFADALNMATGIGDNWPQREPNDFMADENTPKMIQQWLRKAQTAQEKLDVSFSYGKYPWGPGEVLRYNSTHTFVLAAAMDSLLKRQAGPQAHLWDMVLAEVFQPIGIFHAPMMHTQERDGGRGIPPLAYGLYVTIDDVAKLATLLQHGGQHQGQQLLSATKLAEALYQTDTRGLPTGGGWYNLSFWSASHQSRTGCSFQIPYMAGLWGNFVVLLPNGISAFRFADGDNYDVDPMVLVGEVIRPFPCPSGPGEKPRKP